MVSVRIVQSVLIFLACLLGGCAEAPVSTLQAKGPAASRIASLSWWLFGLGAFVYLGVMAFLLLALVRARRDQPPALAQAGEATKVVFLGGAVIPAVVLVAVFGLTLGTLRGVAPAEAPGALTIEVAGHQWWWEIRYPDEQITTANEIHIPAGRPVRLQLHSLDVIHSFWVPELHGKLDMIPGQTNILWLQAGEPGEYRGVCAEFCGLQHAKMAFLVVAEPAEAFAAWAERERQPAAGPADALAEQGQQLFLEMACADCHTVRGTAAAGTLGPDLTHLMSRHTLAAATLANTRGNLAGWIVDPQHAKPGNLMPQTDLSGEQLLALLAYLESLR
ncbi:MAG: cytochrome c oxidase subunit II [Chloroflexi bacterium]|nr:cytochrome c oxidase subunit II [Chloroflexota bacterium]MCI0648630.1 cytochrome c oxidase subunit II [Chloroflexota bacterium]MCI0728161.1 cytochrome c oxidase subunit II [Chloroflexota bacterium]